MLPPEVGELHRFGGAAYKLRMCPLCGAYYDYFYDHDSGGGTSVGGTLESIRRLTNEEAIAEIRAALHELPFEPIALLEEDFERLLRDHAPHDTSIDECIAAMLAVERAKADGSANDWRRSWELTSTARVAVWSLGRQTVPAAMPTLLQGLGNDDVRAYAARALACYGGVAVPALLERLERGDRAERIAVAAALGVIGPAAEAARGALIARVDSMSPHTYDPHHEMPTYASALGRIGYSVEAVRSLLRFFGADYTWEREVSIRAVARMGAASVPALMETLDDETRRLDAIVALTELGPAAAAAVPKLESLRATTPKESGTTMAALERALEVLRSEWTGSL